MVLLGILVMLPRDILTATWRNMLKNYVVLFALSVIADLEQRIAEIQ